MRFYRATTFLFPRNYEWRILLICFGAVHVPLITYVSLQVITGEWQPTALIALLLATLLGTGFGITAIHALLSPIARATAMLEAIQNGERISHIPDGGSDLVGRLLHGVATAANESAARIEQLVTAAERDALTGIRNRRGFLDAAEKILQGNANAVLAFIDIDHFKLINDQFGHDAGDSLLRALAKRLEGGLRRTDVAARWGGEEFAVLFPDTQLDEARLVLERLRASIALDCELGQDSWPVTFSCGLAPLRSFAELGDATRRADAALYVAKARGRNRLQIAEEEQLEEE
ncbi:GGDEF domain-containing protein [Novosphingobium mathurense]|uniref:diguanylate cyclase n=1 Tax=Novosphingobium mathurense TaxID=428990 RepID=A0A1U6HIS4_9SPHN|nr:GGDEF domain-containing protein [Novosphingobium mathurense]SLJ95672.1 diguanylate cyclase (GGDEF) domain-containing protein [Novosphingobium mathurense]